jgi:hypothetical protein
VTQTPPEQPTISRLRKLIALAEDRRGDSKIRKIAQAKLALYARFYPGLIREKKPNDTARKDRL